MVMAMRQAPLLGLLAVVVLAASIFFFLAAGPESSGSSEIALSDDDLAGRLAQNPATLLRPGENWRDLPAPARTIWTTWRFGMIAGGAIPWMSAEGMPTSIEMKAGFVELGLPRAATLVDSCLATDPAPGHTGAADAAGRERFQAMRREIATAQLAYVRVHLHEISKQRN